MSGKDATMFADHGTMYAKDAPRKRASASAMSAKDATMFAE